MMRPDDRAVDHLQGGIAAAAIIEGVKDQFPQSRQRPAPELAIDRRPFPKTIGQIPPWSPRSGNPENAIQNKTMVLWTPAAPRAAFNHKRLKTDPFLVAHQSTDHGSLRQSYLESVSQ